MLTTAAPLLAILLTHHHTPTTPCTEQERKVVAKAHTAAHANKVVCPCCGKVANVVDWMVKKRVERTLMQPPTTNAYHHCLCNDPCSGPSTAHMCPYPLLLVGPVPGSPGRSMLVPWMCCTRMQPHDSAPWHHPQRASWELLVLSLQTTPLPRLWCCRSAMGSRKTLSIDLCCHRCHHWEEAAGLLHSKSRLCWDQPPT